MSELELYNQKTFEDLKHLTEDGIEYWYARELMEILEYKDWRNFLNVIDKAKNSVEATQIAIKDHFVDVNKIVEAGISSKTITDIMLTRYACYLIVQNGDSKKKMIALGQQYFAIQTRKQELSEEKAPKDLTEEEKRLLLRGHV